MSLEGMLEDERQSETEYGIGNIGVGRAETASAPTRAGLNGKLRVSLRLRLTIMEYSS